MACRRHRFTQRRKALGFTQESFAEYLGVERSTVVRWESGETEPLPWIRPKIARALKVTSDQLSELLSEKLLVVDNAFVKESGSWWRGEATVQNTEMDAPIDSDYVCAIRDDIGIFVRLDQKFGGNETSPLIVRAFRQIDRRMNNSEIQKGLQRDVYAVAAEVAEVAGWSLYDADEYEKAELINHKSISLARLAGDRSMELFVLQNMSMQASHLGHARVSLDIARLALETGRPSRRVQALFKIRQARALAQLKADHEAHQQLSRAHSLFLDGIQENDPPWAWWVDENELAWHEGMIELHLGNTGKCVEFFERSAAGIPEHRVRTNYNHRTSLLHAYVLNKSWTQAEDVMGTLLHTVGSVGSRRTDRLLGETLSIVDHCEPTSKIRDLTSAFETGSY